MTNVWLSTQRVTQKICQDIYELIFVYDIYESKCLGVNWCANQSVDAADSESVRTCC